MTKLLIVESPAKAKTISEYLGPGWMVRASYGHIRDLPKGDLGVAVDRGFEPVYKPLETKGKVVQALREAAARATEIYLATDFDREGEAIAWHVAELLDVPESKRQRITFTEITKNAILSALNSPRELDMDLVMAQQSRRILDRLVGYTLSPLVSDWLRGRLSAGRVQSAGLKIIVEREREILNFKPVTYYRVRGLVEALGADASFWAGLISVDGRQVNPQEMVEKAEAERIAEALKAGTAQITGVVEEDVERNPPPPFTTSNLQQEASRKLGFAPKKTMDLAQELYQGVDTGSGTKGLITYMRTDSVNLAPEAVDAIRDFLANTYPAEYRSPQPRTYKSRTKGAQEAHEAIRPTDVNMVPSAARAFLAKDQADLYELIWLRAVATQMAAAKYATMKIDVAVASPKPGGGTATFGLAAKGRRQIFDGFLTLYEEGSDDEEKKTDEEEEVEQLPAVSVGQAAKITKAEAPESQTRPPQRFTEASFIKELEKRGIGRPSTYAATVTTLKDRGYVEVQRKKLVPTDLGTVLVEVLEKHFSEIVDSEFTAGMEESLDQIAEGAENWQRFLAGFWEEFEAQVEERRDAVRPEEILGAVDYPCPQCGATLLVRFGKNGKFVACSAYPNCRYAMGSEAVRTDEKCPSCGEGHLIQRSKGDYTYLSCEMYPNCRYIRGADDKVTNRTCPKCGKGRVLERLSRPKKGRGKGAKKSDGETKTYFVCELRPNCDWLEDPSVIATDETCPACKEGQLLQRDGQYGAYLACSRRREGCAYLRQVDDVFTGDECPECGGRLVTRKGKKGEYVCCEFRPACEYLKSDRPPAKKTGVACSKCSKGEMIERVGKKGVFWGCSNYPKCKHTLNNQPLPVTCTDCGGMVVQTATKAECSECGKAA